MVVIYLYTGLTTGKIGITGNVYNTGRGDIKANVRIKVHNTVKVVLQVRNIANTKH